MKRGFVKSSPVFFRLICCSMFAAFLLLAAAAWFLPAPLEEAADPAVTPNPAKSAWFLLWIQEVMSWSKAMIYPLFVSGVLFVLLPWVPIRCRVHHARWFPAEQRGVQISALAVALFLLVLTAVGMFFRGGNWSFAF